MKKLRGHWLDVTSWRDDYGIEQVEMELVHPEGCPVDYFPTDDPDGPVMRSWRCNVGGLESDAGLDTYIDRAALEPGWYEIEFWSSHTLSTPSFPEEWDAGLTLGRGPYPAPPGTFAYEMAVLSESVLALARAAAPPLPRFLRRWRPA